MSLNARDIFIGRHKRKEERDNPIQEKEQCIRKLYIEHTIQVNGMHETTKRMQDNNEQLRRKIEDQEIDNYKQFERTKIAETEVRSLKVKLDASLLQTDLVETYRAELESKVQELETLLLLCYYNLAWTFVRYQSLARRISAKEGYEIVARDGSQKRCKLMDDLQKWED
ncbi:hypothetical protein RCL1_003957 [Eukaryota sp. TZLM3-RCL]